MKKTILFVGLLAGTFSVFAQKKTTTSGVVNFDATTSIDALPKAENKTVIAALDTKKGTLAFEVPMKNFAFSNPRIQEHFNGERWLNSEKFPTATFAGKITNLSEVNFSKDGAYDANVTGDLTIKGVTKPVTTSGKITVKGKSVLANADFDIKLEDYGVDGPQMASGKIAKEPKITVAAEMQ